VAVFFELFRDWLFISGDYGELLSIKREEIILEIIMKRGSFRRLEAREMTTIKKL